MIGPRPSAAQRPRIGVQPALDAGWWIVMTLLPLGHLTGVRNTMTVIVVVATFAWARRACWDGLPARWWCLGILGWCGLSIAWSVVPAISFGKWRTDLLLPLLAYAAAFGYVTRTRRMTAIVGGTVSGLVCLGVLSLPAVLPAAVAASLASHVASETFATIVNPMPIWFPGVGDASMAVALAVIGLLRMHWPTELSPRRRAIASTMLFAGLAILILFAINNRNATLAIPVVVLLAFWLDRRQARRTGRTTRSRTARWLTPMVIGIVLTGSLALVEIGARHRLQQMGTPVGDRESGLLKLTERDTRPLIWRYYTRLALNAPWVGVGFGRTVPGITYHTASDRALAQVEANAYSHAHNLFLDWWLQTGVVGLGLLLGLLGAIVVTAARVCRVALPDGRASAVTVMALVAIMLARDLTDDFLIFGMASMFWILVGTRAATMRAGRNPREDSA